MPSLHHQRKASHRLSMAQSPTMPPSATHNDSDSDLAPLLISTSSNSNSNANSAPGNHHLTKHAINHRSSNHSPSVEMQQIHKIDVQQASSGSSQHPLEDDRYYYTTDANGNGQPMLRHQLSHSSNGSPDWRLFQLGIRLGFLLLLLFWACWDILVDGKIRPNAAVTWVQSVLPVYRGIGCLILLGWCWGLQCWIWSRYKINYYYLFGLTTSPATPPLSSIQHGYKYTYMIYSEVFEEMTFVTIIYLANFLLYYKILRGDFPPIVPSGYFPIALFVYILYKILPLSSMYETFVSTVWNTQGSNTAPTTMSNPYHFVWSALLSVITSPFTPVTFPISYIGDVLTSSVRPMVDLTYTMCLTLSFDWTHDDTLSTEVPERCFHAVSFKRFVVPLISAAPLWFRCMQCCRRYYDTHDRWPHLANAGKYALSHSVVLMGVFHNSFYKPDPAGEDDTFIGQLKHYWIMSLVSSTIYNFLWDVYMDFGLGRKPHKFLRERLLYDNVLVYYAAIVIDLFMRFSWTLTLLPVVYATTTPEQTKDWYSDWLMVIQPLLAGAEVIRRGMWSVLRVEYEYITQSATMKKFELMTSPTSATVTQNMQTANTQLTKHRSPRSGWRVVTEVSAMVLGVILTAAIAAMTAN